MTITRAVTPEPTLKKELTPTQEHFLKKELIALQLTHEFLLLQTVEGLRGFGPPFSPTAKGEFPLLRFFFDTYILTFPFLVNDTAFWHDKFQPFYETLVAKNLSSSRDRGELSKRRQTSNKLTSGLRLLFVSILATKTDPEYYRSSVPNLDTIDKVTKKESTLLASDVEAMLHLSPPAKGVVTSVCGVRHVQGAATSGWFRTSNPSHYEFLIHVCGADSSHYTSKRYSEFQALDRKLHQAFPGKDLPALPAKVKTEAMAPPLSPSLDSRVSALEMLPISPSSTNSTFAKPASITLDFNTPAAPTVVPREYLRRSLRSYLKKLLLNPEIASSSLVTSFLSASTPLTQADRCDMAIRTELDRGRILTQVEFQKRSQMRALSLKGEIEGLKHRLLHDPQALQSLFAEIGSATLVSGLQTSSLRSFIELMKIETALTIYEMFLGQDTSREWFRAIQRMHAYFPFTVLVGILHITNPLKLMTAVVNLFLSTSVIPFGGTSLMQMCFGSLLNDDLRDQEKELEALRLLVPVLVQTRLQAYLEASDAVVGRVKQTSTLDLLWAILTAPELGASLPERDLEALKDETDPLRSNAKLFLHLLLRQRDKRLMKEIWAEPYLIGLIKELFTHFFTPLVAVFKLANLPLALRDFQAFMTDLLRTIERLYDHLHDLPPSALLAEIMAVIERHEDRMMFFISEVYRKDQNRFFLGIIQWLERFLKALQFKLKLDVLLDLNPFVRAHPEVMPTVDAVVARTLAKRLIHSELLQSQATDYDDRIKQAWDQINDFSEFGTNEFGLHVDDLLDLDIETGEFANTANASEISQRLDAVTAHHDESVVFDPLRHSFSLAAGGLLDLVAKSLAT